MLLTTLDAVDANGDIDIERCKQNLKEVMKGKNIFPTTFGSTSEAAHATP